MAQKELSRNKANVLFQTVNVKVGQHWNVPNGKST